MRVPDIARTMKPKSAMWSKDNRYLCLRDVDGDGRFESYFWLYTQMLTAFIGTWPVLEPEGAINATSYQEIDPVKSFDAPYLTLIYDNDAKLVGKVRFIGVPANENSDAPLLSYVRPSIDVAVKSLPVRFSAFGGEFEIVSKTGSDLTVRTITPFTAGPFSVGW